MACNLCGSSIYKNYLKKDGHNIVECSHCGLVYTLLNGQKIKNDFYSKDYFVESGYSNYEETAQYIKISFKRILKKILHEVPFQKRSLLDIGCATGILLEAAKSLELEPFGVEISKYAAHKGIKKGFKIFNAPLEEIDFKDHKYDIITICFKVKVLLFQKR